MTLTECEACGTTDRVEFDAHGWFCVACRDSDYNPPLGWDRAEAEGQWWEW